MGDHRRITASTFFFCPRLSGTESSKLANKFPFRQLSRNRIRGISKHNFLFFVCSHSQKQDSVTRHPIDERHRSWWRLKQRALCRTQPPALPPCSAPGAAGSLCVRAQRDVFLVARRQTLHRPSPFPFRARESRASCDERVSARA